MWNLIVSVPDHCLSFYFGLFTTSRSLTIVNLVGHHSVSLLYRERMGVSELKMWLS